MDTIIYVIVFLLPVFPAIKMASRPKSKVCPKCGARLQGDYPVCSVCGRHIGTHVGGIGMFFLSYLACLLIGVVAFALLCLVFAKLFGH